jgi:hypothetical protein
MRYLVNGEKLNTKFFVFALQTQKLLASESAFILQVPYPFYDDFKTPS